MTSVRIANAPCSWGVLEFEGMAPPASAAQVLDEMRESGYAGTELGDWGFLPTAPDALSAQLAPRGLELVGAFVPVELADPTQHMDGVHRACEVAVLLAAVGDAPFIVLSDENATDPNRTARAGSIRPEDGLDAAGMATFAAGANRVAQSVFEETGVRTVFHHHCAGWIETPDETSRFLDATDSDVLGLCLDTGHWVFGGGDPLAALTRYGDRIWHVHFKDCDAEVAAQSRREGRDYFASVRAGIFCELGRGAVDFGGVTSHLQARDYSGWIVVEQDVLPGMGSPLESAQRNRTYLHSLGL